MSQLSFELLIPRRPVSLQCKKKQNLRLWKDYVYNLAFQKWEGLPIDGQYLHLTLVYLCRDLPDDPSLLDIDNIIKPIQDSLVGVVVSDDRFISDVDGHRRFLSHPIDITNLPSLLQYAILNGSECVYVRVKNAQKLEKYL